ANVRASAAYCAGVRPCGFNAEHVNGRSCAPVISRMPAMPNRGPRKRAANVAGTSTSTSATSSCSDVLPNSMLRSCPASKPVVSATIRIVTVDVASRPRADFEIHRRRARPVDQVVAVRCVLRECRTIAGTQDHLASVRHERQFAGQHIDEFVFLLVPVALTRPGAGRQKSEINA